VPRGKELGEPGAQGGFEEGPLFLDAKGGDGRLVLVRSILKETRGAGQGAMEVKALDTEEDGGIDLSVGDREERCPGVEGSKLTLDQGAPVC
jgi:hypothetical protein